MPDWTDRRWLADAHAWIRAHADVTGEIEQPHVRPWGTVLRAPTSAGDVWFKTSVPALAHEAGLVGVLARERPDAVPELLAFDRERSWMLMADGGLRMREVVERERDLGLWLDVLSRYAQLQLDLAPHANELLALGTPDHRLAILPARAAEIPELAEHVDAIAGLCARLAAVPIPETIQHDDLHDGNVFLRDGRPLFFDWGDSCVAHPFLSMSVTLEGLIAWGVDDVRDSEDLAPYRAAYLAPFAGHASQEDLADALDAALRLGWVSRVLTTHRYASTLDPSDRDEQLAGVAVRVEMFRAGL